MDVKRSDPQTPEAREASAAGPSCPGAPAPAAGKPEEPASSEQDKGSGSAGPSAEKMAQMKEHKENVDANSEEEASIRLALELMRQESWEMHRIMQNETLLAMQEQKREALNRGTQNSHSIDEDLKLALALAQEENDIEERLQAGEFDDVDIDDMTHEELVDLGHRMGDVKQEQWKRQAQEAVDKLPTKRYKKDSKQEDVHLCTVCQCEFEQDDVIKVLPCKHRFHNGCIGDWLKKNPECPLCKRSIMDNTDGSQETTENTPNSESPSAESDA